MRAFTLLLSVLGLARLVFSSPPNFPQSGNGLWYSTPGVSWWTDYLPVGNGYLAGSPSFNLGHLRCSLNGPFLPARRSHDTRGNLV